MVVAQILLLTYQVKHESQEMNKKVDSSRISRVVFNLVLFVFTN